MSASNSPHNRPHPLPAHTTQTSTPEAHNPHLQLSGFPFSSQPGSQGSSPISAASDSFFENALGQRSTPSPSFFDLDYILNPAEPSFIDRFTPLDWANRPSPLRRGPRSPVLTPDFNYRPNQMPSSRHARSANGYVDLTREASTSTSPVLGAHTRRNSKRTNTMASSPEPAAGPSTKRIKRNNGMAAETAPTAPTAPPAPEAWIEEIDLSQRKAPLQDILQKQRAEAVKAQQKPDEKPSSLLNMTCVICMDTPSDLTATSCGHLFCHTCLMEALIAGENRSAPGEPKRSQCPVCRKFINRSKPNDIIPLLMMKGLATQPRKNAAENIAKAQ